MFAEAGVERLIRDLAVYPSVTAEPGADQVPRGRPDDLDPPSHYDERSVGLRLANKPPYRLPYGVVFLGGETTYIGLIK
jgi:hypothetical protein